MLDNLTDEEIIEKLKDCETGSDSIGQDFKTVFKIIYDRYYRRIYGLCRHYGLKADDSDDVVQEAFIKLYRCIKSFKKGRTFKPWFFQVVFNELKDKYSYNKKHSSEDLLEMKDTLGKEDENISEDLQNREYIRGITIRLPEKLRKVLILKIYDCMDFDEIARIENISSRTARNRLEKAYALARGYLEEENERKTQRNKN